MIVLIFSQIVFAQKDYKTYSNARFGYSISYPADLLAAQDEADNGDGRVFKNDDAEMRVYGSNLALGETLEKEYRAVLENYGKFVTYKTLNKDFFVISGARKDKVFYRKTIENKDGIYITFEIEYKKSKRAVYDKVVRKTVKSFKV